MKKLFLLLTLGCMSFAAWAEAVYCNYTDSKQQQWSYYVNDSESPEYVTITNVWAPSSTTELVFPNSLPYGEAFYPVKEIKSNSTWSIADEGLRSSVTSIKLPSSLTAIIDYEGAEEYAKYQSGAFYRFQSLNSITIPASLTSIGQYTFNECWSLSTIYMEATTPPAYSASVFHSYMMPPSIIVPTASLASYKASEDWKDYVYCQEEMVDHTYTDANGVTWTYRLNITDSSVRVSSVTGYTTELIFPASIPHDGKDMPIEGVTFGFDNNENIIKVDLSATQIKSIRMGGGAWGGSPSLYFNNCPSLQTVILPSTLEEIGSSAFSYCPNLQTINWTNLTALKNIGSGAFQSDWNNRFTRITAIDLSFTQLESIGSYAFQEFDNLQEIKFPSSLETIGNNAFESCNQLRDIDLSHTKIATIESQTFHYSSLETVKLPSSLKKIASYAFASNNLRDINLSNVEVIEERAFESCSNLQEIDLSSVTSVGLSAFTSDLTVTINSITPASIKANSFTDNTKFIVTSHAYNTFCTAPIWSNWANNINMCNVDENGIKWIFRYSTDSNGLCITSASGYGAEVTLPNALPYNGADYPVTGIGNYAFAEREYYYEGEGYATRLSSIVLPTSVKNIGIGAFQYCNYLRSINLSNVEAIGDYAFQGCSLSNPDLSSTKVIGSKAFTNSHTFTINSTTPATIKSDSFTEYSTFIVSSDGYNAFCTAEIWSNWANYISMSNVDENGIKWMYRYLADNNGLCITSVSGYGTEVTIPSTLPYNGADYPVSGIGNNAFSGSKLTSVNIPASVTSIGSYAFYQNSNLTSITFEPNSALQSIGDYAFAGNEYDYGNGYATQLASIVLPASVKNIGAGAFQYCRYLKSINLSNVEAIGNYAFRGCYNLRLIDLLNVKTIGDYAFYGINITSADLSSATSIGYNAFYYSGESGGSEPFFKVDNTTPATLASGAFPSNSMFLVPGSAVTTYKTANVWSDYASRIFASNIAVQSINVTAQAKGSGVLEAIGGSVNQTNIIDLKVKGTINGYDFVMFKDKMLNLRFLDLSEATVVYNPYCYYEYNYSQNDTLGAYAFNQENKLVSIKLPKGIKHIGSNAFSECYSLREVVFGDKLESIGYGAFRSCSNLDDITLPDGLRRIDSEAFSSCSSLSNLTLPNTVKRIEYGTFQSCYNLKELTFPNQLEYIGGYAFSNTGLKEVHFPTTLKTIEYSAFQSCSQLETVRIPSSLEYVREGAFQWCSNLKHVYTCTIEPTDINENTFSTFETANLYVPKASGQNYYWDEGWKRFLNIWEFDEEYLYFYLNGDHTLDESTGAVDGTPEADLNAGSGLIVEEEVEQNMSDLNINHDGENGGSIIAGSAEGNVHADSLHVNINVQSGRWYFFSFPFDLKKKDISMANEETQYVFRRYNGEKRAEGNSGWENVEEVDGYYLRAGVGYIFQCNQYDVLTISLADVTFKREDKSNELEGHASGNVQDASWNFVGNPYLSYYDMSAIGYDAPITIWNGYSYEAIKPGDDDYQFAPFEAFFVQKPEGTDAMEFDGDEQTTYRGSQAKADAARARRRTQTIDSERLLVNLTISNGQETDRTRIVFNNNVSMNYEMACDAAKFDAAGVPQLYTIDSRAVKYAINERPVAEGIVTLGYSVPVQGNYTLAAPRMDTPVAVKDNLTGTIHNFSDGDYEFASEAGVFEDRFTVIMKAGETSIDNVGIRNQESEIYNVKGQRVNSASEQGIYIKNNRKVVKM